LLKQQGGPLGPGVTALLEMLDTYTGIVATEPEYPNLGFQVFWNSYPTFTDTNNLSLVLFLNLGSFSIVFPGDLESAGWYTLLENSSFRANLAHVKIFVAAHHGRESGYCREVFDYCSPEIVIISDDNIQYDTQEHNYGEHAAGIRWNGAESRKVLTTRKDGHIGITKQIGQPGYYVQTMR
jgi:beta-lactamase superfamily II metal-dependent hydrolase